MRFTLKSLILIVVLLGGLAAWYSSMIKKSDPYYRGYFYQDGRVQELIHRVDPAVNIEGSGGGGGGSDQYVMHMSHSLKSALPIGEELINKMRRQLRQDLQDQGVRILADKDAHGGDSNYPTAGVRLITWGFQFLFEEKGHKGVIILQLRSKTIPGVPSLGHLADLQENIVVFPRD